MVDFGEHRERDIERIAALVDVGMVELAEDLKEDPKVIIIRLFFNRIKLP